MSPAGASLDEKTHYALMFGPDKCGADDYIYVVLQRQHPVSGLWKQHFLKQMPPVPEDTMPHQYRFDMYPNGTFALFLDAEVVRSGGILNSFQPPLVPPRMVPDTKVGRPVNWEEETILAPVPVGWREDVPQWSPDPSSAPPAGWDTEEDGEWEGPFRADPRCPNADPQLEDTRTRAQSSKGKDAAGAEPAFLWALWGRLVGETFAGCGPWDVRMPNPNYKVYANLPEVRCLGYLAVNFICVCVFQGPWSAPLVPNPDAYSPELASPASVLTGLCGIALEVWTVSPGAILDNILITTDFARAGAASLQFLKMRALMVKRDKELRILALKRARDSGEWSDLFEFGLRETMARTAHWPVPLPLLVPILLFPPLMITMWRLMEKNSPENVPEYEQYLCRLELEARNNETKVKKVQ